MIPRLTRPLPRLDPARFPPRFGETPEETTRSLGDLGLANHRFGGTRSVLEPIRELLAARGGRMRILDVGCGRADIARALTAWARHAGLSIRVVAVDDHPAVVGMAAAASGEAPEITLLQADAGRLPFAPRSFDVVVASMLLHYFSFDKAARLLHAWARLASLAVVISDIERHRLPYLATRWLGAVATCSLFAEGSRRTILRGFTRAELAGLAARAGLQGVIVRRHFPFRLSLQGHVV